MRADSDTANSAGASGTRAAARNAEERPTSGGALLGYELVGAGGDGVIVLNDWLADCTSWRPMHSYLDGRTFTYAFTDLRGYGRSRQITGQYNASEAATDILAVADHLGWDRFHVAGFSMTGMVIERLVLDAPDRIKTEIAVGAASAAGVPLSDEERGFFLSTLTDDDAVRELAARICSRKLSDSWLDHKLMLERTTRTREAPPNYLQMWTNPAYAFADEVAAAKPEVPLLVVVGEWDHEAFLEPRMQETFMAWHPNAELVVIRNCGHCPMQETPVYLATLMEDFMRRHSH